jgi:putative redox protein
MAQLLQIRQHSLLADEPPEVGGEDEGPRPHEFYDAALGACKALTVMWYARKKGFAVDDVKTIVVRDDSQERQGTYRLRAELQISGALSDAELAQLAAAAEKCPVHKLMTTVTTEIETVVTRQA